jgi:hypothetical protein
LWLNTEISTEIIVAISAAIVSVVSAVLSVVAGTRVTQLEHRLALQREEVTRKRQLHDIMGRYRQPVLRAAVDLQSRFYNIVQNRFLHRYFVASESDPVGYATASTLYVIAEYLGWVEILRREVQYLDLGDLEANRRMTDLLEEISQWFLIDHLDDAFRLFRGEQRAIGELMLIIRPADELARYECMGFAAFTQKLEDHDFAKWFTRLTNDVERLANCKDVRQQRVLNLQHALIDLIDFLDPDCARVPASRRQKIP